MDMSKKEVPDWQKNPEVVIKLVRVCGLVFFLIGAIICLTGGDQFVGAVLSIMGILDIVLIPRVLEAVMSKKKQSQENQGN